MMIVIADTSALVALATCNGLALLDALFNKVAVPYSVYQECVVEGKPQARVLEEYLKGKFEPDIQEPDLYLPSYLGRGEVDAMVLYKRLHANYLLIDDYRARKVAALNAIPVIGSLGVILLAKKKGHLSSIKPYIQQLRESDIYINEELLMQVLRMAGE